MKLSIYKNPRTGHTYQVNRQGSRFLIVERDWLGNIFQIMAIYNKQENARMCWINCVTQWIGVFAENKKRQGS